MAKRPFALCHLPLAIACAALYLGASVPAATQSQDMRVIAEVNGRQILVADVLAKLAVERRRGLAEQRLDAFTPAARERTLDGLVEHMLLAAGARDAGIDQRPDVKRQIDALVDEFLAERLTAEVTAREATEPALRAYYTAHASEFVDAGRVRARHIVVKTEAEAVALYGRLRRNADFAELARANNIDASRAAGGEIGWVTRGVMVESFEKALFSLRQGETSQIVRTPYGFHIAQAEEIEPPKQKPFEAVAGEVRARVVRQHVDALKAELAKKHPVRVRTEVLKSLQ